MDSRAEGVAGVVRDVQSLRIGPDDCVGYLIARMRGEPPFEPKARGTAHPDGTVRDTRLQKQQKYFLDLAFSRE